MVFDLDGTLVDTAPDLITALNYVLDREGLPPVPMASARNMIGAGARKLIERGLEAEGRSVTPADMDRMTADFIAYYADHIAVEIAPLRGTRGRARPFFGPRPSPRGLHQQAGMAVQAAAGPARSHPPLRRDLRRRHFGVQKPDPTIFRETVARAGGTVKASIMVGDAGTDVGVARRAGVPVIGVSFGYTDVPIAELKPDRLIHHMRDLPAAATSLMTV
ncbi:HAD hydrolase-like protein [Bradyrhizobium guangxiense]